MKLLERSPPAVLRRDLRQSDAPQMILRRAVIGASLVGVACMAVTRTRRRSRSRYLFHDMPVVEKAVGENVTRDSRPCGIHRPARRS